MSAPACAMPGMSIIVGATAWSWAQASCAADAATGLTSRAIAAIRASRNRIIQAKLRRNAQTVDVIILLALCALAMRLEKDRIDAKSKGSRKLLGDDTSAQGLFNRVAAAVTD